jgi:DUF2924 family protein
LRPPCPLARLCSGLQAVGAPASCTNIGGHMEMASASPDQSVSSASRAGGRTTTTSQPEISEKIAALTALTAPQLRTEWRRLYRYNPPRLSRDLLIRTIAYRMQELAYGGLSKRTQRRLVALTKELQTNGSIAPDPGPRVRPGVGLVREWRGRTHSIQTCQSGSKSIVRRRTLAITLAPGRHPRL